MTTHVTYSVFGKSFPRQLAINHLTNQSTNQLTMVQLTQVEDEQIIEEKAPQVVPQENDDDYTDTSVSDSEDDDEFFQDETIYERIVALKDIIPPTQRSSLVSFASSFSSTLSSLFSKSGSLLWVVTSSALLLGVPLSLSILSEQQLKEMEKEFTLQQTSNEVLAPGSEQAFQQPGQAQSSA
ncbi:BA75_02253T0 [Komagataella pastoris]|uniref:BA75_02253T0 n=1 Tax=Komagataella pastoris TaxID=4922 RepID=A0A1B2JC38_PICPA|nr:BA75_02253T0 [Komagataella pastoris]